MYRTIVFLILLTVALPSEAAPGSAMIAQNGQSRATIVIRDRAPGCVRFAATQLQHYLQRVSGATFSIRHQPSKGTNLYVGQGPWMAQVGLDANQLKRDGFYRVVKNGNLYILGRDDDAKSFTPYGWKAIYSEHGTLFGVYDFLEDVAGVRWFAPGEIGEVVPNRPTLQADPQTLKKEPAFSDRQWNQPNIHYYKYPDAAVYTDDVKGMYLWVLRLRWSSHIVVRGSHAAHRLKYGQRFGQEHPQWFALMKNGQHAINTPRGAYLNWSADGVIDEIIKDARAKLTGQPPQSRGLDTWNENIYGDAFMVDPNDAFIVSQDPVTQAILKRYPKTGTSELIFGAVAKVAEAVKDIPGARITTLAYPPKLLPPKSVQIPENVSVRLCIPGAKAIVRPRAHRAQMQLIHQWRDRLKGGLTLWTYPLTASYMQHLRGAVETMPHLIGKFFQEIDPYVDGLYFQNIAINQTYRNLDTYVMMRLAWDPSQNVDELLQDYFSKMYGPAAEPIGKLYDRMEKLWLDVLTFYPEPQEGDPNKLRGAAYAVASRIDLWEKIYNTDVLTELDGLLKEAQQRTQGQPIYAKRVAVLRKWMYGTILAHRQQYLAELGGADRVAMVSHYTPASPDKQGRLPNQAWQSASWQTLVSASDQHDVRVSTQFKLLWNERYLFVRARMQEPHMDRSRTALGREPDNKAIWKDNDFEIMFDTHDEFNTSYQWLINDRGVLADVEKKLGQMNWGWDSGATSHVQRTADGWQLDMAMPLDRFDIDSLDKTLSFGLNVVRHRSLIEAPDEFYTWSPPAKLGRWNDALLWGVIRFDRSTGMGSEQVKDPSFEQHPSGWVLPKTYGNHLAIVSDQTADGKRSLRIQHQKADSSYALQRFSGLKPGTRYRLRCQVKLQNVQTGEAQGKAPPAYDGATLQFYVPGTNLFTPLPALQGTSDWRTVEATVTTAKTFGSKPVFYLRLWLRNSSGIVWFDQVSIKELKGLPSN